MELGHLNVDLLDTLKATTVQLLIQYNTTTRAFKLNLELNQQLSATKMEQYKLHKHSRYRKTNVLNFIIL